MKIAVDITPLVAKDTGHKVRGVGFYLEHLKKSLLDNFPEEHFHFFSKGERIPKDTDIVHYPYFEPFFLTQPLLLNFPTVFTVHDLTPIIFKEHFPSGLKGDVKWKINKNILKRAAAIITDSKCSQKDISRVVGVDSSKIHVAYLAAGEEFSIGSSNSDQKDTMRKKYGLPDKFVLYVGDVTWNKNLPRLVEAVIGTDITLVMVGKSLTQSDYVKDNIWNKDLAIVQDLVKKNKNIMTIGFVSSEDLVALYRMATALVMPSLYEGFGLPILEAMACGTPVITSKEGSLPEVAGDAALYIDAKSIESIKAGIIKVYSDPILQKQLSVKGLDQVGKFSWKQTAIETMSIYKAVAKT